MRNFLIFLFLINLFSSAVYAQSSPADLLDLSLTELMDFEIKDKFSSDGSVAISSRWSLEYKYTYAKFRGFRDGTKDLSDDEVLFSAGEARTSKNFKILPNNIRQEAHILNISYAVNNLYFLTLGLPYIKQSTAHVSTVPNYGRFTIESAGVGDITLAASRLFRPSGKHLLTANAGVTLPVGAINKVGDTPRAAGNQPLPYTMQIGSGTYDLIPSLTYLSTHQGVDWGVGGFAKVRLGRNERGYRLGNRYQMIGWAQGKWYKWVYPSLKVKATYWQRITGEDEALNVPGSFPYPANVTDPSMFGGKKLTLQFGTQFNLPGESLQGSKIQFEFALPVYQNLNGPQAEEDFNFSLALNHRF